MHEDKTPISESFFLNTITLFLDRIQRMVTNRIDKLERKVDKMATDIATIQAKLEQVKTDYSELKERVTADYNDRVTAHAAQQVQIEDLKKQIADLLAAGGGATAEQLQALDDGLSTLSADMDAQDLNPAFPAPPPPPPA